jgi:hypothetical protein
VSFQQRRWRAQIVEARVWLNTDVPAGGGIRAEIGFSGYLVDIP